MVLKAIETHYKGYRFRSRSEARFAVFLDSLGVAWDYEVEGYDLGEHGKYLPDFWLPEIGVFIEIKGADPTANEQLKALALAAQAEKPVYIFFGGMEVPQGSKSPFRVTKGTRALGYGAAIPSINWTRRPYPNLSFLWGECSSCGAVDIVGITPSLKVSKSICRCPQQVLSPTGKRLKKAYDAARGARFEHGERGAAPTAPPKRLGPIPTFTPARKSAFSPPPSKWDGVGIAGKTVRPHWEEDEAGE